MTREYILQNLEAACPIWFIDNPQLRDEVMATLQDSLLIPKPRFKVGDKVKWRGKKVYSIIEERLYNPEANIWAYLLNDMETYINEPYLKLVEDAE